MSPRRSRRRACRPRLDRLDDRCLLAISGFSAAHLTQLYGFNAAGAVGAGQTIAVIDAYDDPYLAGDLANFDRGNGLPGVTSSEVAGFLSQVNQGGGPAGGPTNDGWAGETTLDVEAIHAVAPGARIVVVEARSENLDDMLAAVDTARSMPGVSVVAMSWGSAEFAGETALDYHFTTPAGHTPVTFVAATGDNGGGAEWPSSSPGVVAVGGTTLFVDASGQYNGEMGWSDGGGGFSTIEPEPAYQRAAQASGVRTTPDVSIVADPSSGLMTYTTNPSNGAASWTLSGGTSLSTQLWAGLFADANQARAAVGRATLDSTTALTILYANPGAFNDVQWGFNGFWSVPGYDLGTGLGTPRAPAVITALASSGDTAIVAAPAFSVAPAIARRGAPRRRGHQRRADVTTTPTTVTTTTTSPVDVAPTTTNDMAAPLPTPTPPPTVAATPSPPSALAAASVPAVAAPASLPLTAVPQAVVSPSAYALASAAVRPVDAAKPSRPNERALQSDEADAPAGPADPSPKADPEAKPADPASPPPPLPVEMSPDDGRAWLDRFDPSTEVGPALPPAQVVESVPDGPEEPSATAPVAGAALTLVALWRRRPGKPIASGRREGSPRAVPRGPLGRRSRSDV